MSSDNEIDSIIAELKADAAPSTPKIPEKVESPKLTDDNVSDYVYNKSAELVESTLGAVQSLKDSVLVGSDPKEIAALSQLINSATKALDQLNKINIQNKQSKNNLEVKKLEIAANSGKPALAPTTNIMIATRDQVMAQLFDKPSKKVDKVELLEGEFSKED